MSRLVLVQRAFATWREADAYFDSIAAEAWPYLWCWQDIQSHEWKVMAFVETHHWLAA